MRSPFMKLLYPGLALLVVAAVPLSLLLLSNHAWAGSKPEETPAAFTASELFAYPSTLAQQPTTPGATYRANLEARIDAMSGEFARRPEGPASVELAALYFHRFKLIGQVDDLNRALAVIETRIDAKPDDARARLTRAHVLAGMHRFDEARHDLTRADTSAASELHLQIALASGDYESALTEFNNLTAPTADFYTTVLRGNLAMLQGRLDTASALFLRAQQMYDGSNPYPLAWLFTQQGIALLRTGDCKNASRFFFAAVERIPDYYLAVEHLAECERQQGSIDSARARYLKVIEQTGQPEFIGALADLEREAGNGELAESLDARAERAWNRLLEQHAMTFADHAVEFFLERNDPERALALARRIVEHRKDVLSLALHARVAFENDQEPEGCRSVAAFEATGLTPPERGDIVALIERCSG